MAGRRRCRWGGRWSDVAAVHRRSSTRCAGTSTAAVGLRAQAIGQILGLPTTMTLFCFIGIAVTSATPIIFGKIIWDATEVIARVGSTPVIIISLIMVQSTIPNDASPFCRHRGMNMADVCRLSQCGLNGWPAEAECTAATR